MEPFAKLSTWTFAAALSVGGCAAPSGDTGNGASKFSPSPIHDVYVECGTGSESWSVVYQPAVDDMHVGPQDGNVRTVYVGGAQGPKLVVETGDLKAFQFTDPCLCRDAEAARGVDFIISPDGQKGVCKDHDIAFFHTEHGVTSIKREFPHGNTLGVFDRRAGWSRSVSSCGHTAWVTHARVPECSANLCTKANLSPELCFGGRLDAPPSKPVPTQVARGIN